DPSKFVNQLLQPPIPQARSSLQLGRSLGHLFAKGADVHAQMLVNFAQKLKDNFYDAWSNATVTSVQPPLQAVYVFRVQASLFGGNVHKLPTYTNSKLDPPDQWADWILDSAEADKAAFLDQAYDAILPGSYVILQSQTSVRLPSQNQSS